NVTVENQACNMFINGIHDEPNDNCIILANNWGHSSINLHCIIVLGINEINWPKLNARVVVENKITNEHAS
ncbi:hypothetical protein KI387_001708, partial [Taxus chinensis]